MHKTIPKYWAMVDSHFATWLFAAGFFANTFFSKYICLMAFDLYNGQVLTFQVCTWA